MVRMGRDSFARETITKKQVEGTCHFCGSTNAKGKVFVYEVERDGINTRKEPIAKGHKFCSVSCLNNYLY